MGRELAAPHLQGLQEWRGMPRAGIPWMCTITDTRKGSGSVGTGPGRLGFVCDAGFGWQKQVGAVATVGLGGCPSLLGKEQEERNPGGWEKL